MTEQTDPVADWAKANPDVALNFRGMYAAVTKDLKLFAVDANWSKLMDRLHTSRGSRPEVFVAFVGPRMVKDPETGECDHEGAFLVWHSSYFACSRCKKKLGT